MLKESELLQLKRRGIAPADFEREMENFKKGFPFLKIVNAATPIKGIKVLDNKEITQAFKSFDSFKGVVCKFVPASGAASRMFKDIFEGEEKLLNGEPLPPDSPASKFLNNIKLFPFFNSLNLLKMTLYDKALGYGSLPKGLILFHSYPDGARTAFEEHLVEGALYAKNNKGIVNMVVTVSPEHLRDFRAYFNSVKEKYQKRFKCTYKVNFTTQSPSTDIIAVNLSNNPFYDDKGNFLFRPGGHGALLKNLNEIKADIIIIKNIDNVTRENHIDEAVRWKKILAGRALSLKMERDRHIAALESIKLAHSSNLSSVKTNSDISAQKAVELAAAFLESEFCISTDNVDRKSIIEVLLKKLNRPIRLCGMVKNEGEPGGGPFIIRDNDGCTSLQILEQAQINSAEADSMAALHNSTHFNPVDLVCIIKDNKGKRYNLMDFTDPSTGLISHKSWQGRELKAQELPGLWNGAMSNWNSQFVEVPISTFNPVKTVLDLLRPMHR